MTVESLDIEPLPIHTISIERTSGLSEPVFAIREAHDSNKPEEHIFVLTDLDPDNPHALGMLSIEEDGSVSPRVHLEMEEEQKTRPAVLGQFVTAAVQDMGLESVKVNPEEDTNNLSNKFLYGAGFRGIVGARGLLAFRPQRVC